MYRCPNHGHEAKIYYIKIEKTEHIKKFVLNKTKDTKNL